MKTKYDWSNVPKDVNWIATDSDGWLSMHILEPEKVLNINWIDKTDSGYFYTTPDSQFEGNWQDSLEERPKCF